MMPGGGEERGNEGRPSDMLCFRPSTPHSPSLSLHRFTLHSKHTPQGRGSANPSMEFYVDEKWKFSKKSRNNGSCRRVSGGGGDPFLKRSSSARDQAIGRRSGAGAGAGASSTSGSSFSSRCAGLVKEQRARFYIMRRCVTMLVCWKDCS